MEGDRKMRVVKCKDYEQMSKRAADFVAAQILLKPNCVLGLATGNTPIGMYAQLAAKYAAGELDFAQVTSFNLDEYCGITRDDPNSYYTFMQENLFSKVNIKESFLPNCENEDAQAECAAYEAKIEAYGGIDLQVLGIGQNGHIGFNEPDEQLSSVTHKVALTESTIKVNSALFADPSTMPTTAYTMGIGTIMKSRRIILLASGANKVPALSALRGTKITTGNPSSVLLAHPDVTVFADAAALGE